MGAAQSSLDSYIKIHGHDSLAKLILLRRKLKWLELTCTRIINRKIDDELKNILFRMDHAINSKKQSVLSMYQKTKKQIFMKEAQRLKTFQEKQAKPVENFYGKNEFLNKLNLLKINFHVQCHIIKKRVKKLVDQKITTIQNQTFLAMTSQFISKDKFNQFFNEDKRLSQIYKGDHLLEHRLEEFKKQAIGQLSFESIFWPYLNPEIQKAESQVTKIYLEAGKNIHNMRKDLQGNWNIFKFQSA